MCHCCRTLAILPAVFVCLVVVSVLVAYFTSTLIDKDVYPWIPSIGETNAKQPYVNIFGQLFNICSFLLLITVFVRYLQVKHDAEWNEESRPSIIKLNQAGLALGTLSALGCCVIANFPAEADEQVKTVHLIGAAMVLFCGVAFCWIQTIISYKMKLCGINSSSLYGTRAVCAFLVSLSAVVCIVCKGVADDQWNNVAHNKTTEYWTPQDVGFVPHVISNFTQWIIIIILLVFVLTFLGEFKSMKVKLVVSRYNPLPVPLSVSQESMRTPLMM